MKLSKRALKIDLVVSTIVIVAIIVYLFTLSGSYLDGLTRGIISGTLLGLLICTVRHSIKNKEL